MIRTKKEILDNLKFRIELETGESPNLGYGDPDNIKICILQIDPFYNDISYIKRVTEYIQLHEQSYICCPILSSNLSRSQNQYYLYELIDILNPVVVIIIDDMLLREMKSLDKNNSLSNHRGRLFKSPFLNHKILAVRHPKIYAHKEGNERIKKSARKHWSLILDLVKADRLKFLEEEWLCSRDKAKEIIEKEFPVSA